ncbi:hypothetical protein [Nocardioides ferulae]|uniref:hypothetical protein n=1 Tax=Nocardioides ferulae TaxID=2340821 RepID=UPI000F85DA98|nr:hypothetical protein [Nocardioides ferulae]
MSGRGRWRGLGVLVALAAVATAGGYAAADLAEHGPDTIPTATPLAAESPSYPVTVYDVQPDPTTPPLRRGIELRTVRLRDDPIQVRVAVPEGWMRVALAPGYDSWNFSPPAAPTNTYLLRISLLGERESLAVARLARMAALEDAEANGDLLDLDVEAEGEDAFTATFIDRGGYRRLTYERFLPAPGTTTARVEIAVNGRLADGPGMRDLLRRVAASVRLPQP